MKYEKLNKYSPLMQIFFAFCVATSIFIFISGGIHADDAYMFLRYADRIIEQGYFGWNPDGIHTFGITSLLHLVVVTIIRSLGLPDDLTLKISVLVPAFILVLVWLRISIKFTEENVRTILLLGLLILYLSITVIWKSHLTSGMDTMLGILTNFMLYRAAFSLHEELDSSRRWKFIIFAILAVATRPESVILVLLYLILLGLHYRLSLKALFTKVMFPLLVIILAGVGFLWFYFSNPLPLPFYVKTYNVYGELPAFYNQIPWTASKQFIKLSIPFIITLLFYLPSRRALVFAVVPSTAFIIYCFQLTWIMGYEARFFMPILGVLLGLVSTSIYRNRDITSVKHVFIKNNWLLFGLIILSGLTQINSSDKLSLEDTQPFYMNVSRELVRMDDSLIIAATEHGYLGAVNLNKKIIDLSGLHNVKMSRGFNADVLFKEMPDFILMPRWGYKDMIYMVENDKRFQDYYYMSKFESTVSKVCELEGIGVAILKKSVYSKKLRQLVREAAKKADKR